MNSNIQERIQKHTTWAVLLGMVFLVGGVLAFLWCRHIAESDTERTATAFILCTAAFTVGCGIGFIFSLFSDEQEPFGKIRDAMIAVASGITGAGLAKAADFGSLLARIHVFPPNSEHNASFAILASITFFFIGFFFMYFFRKLALNPALLESRNTMARLDNSGTVSSIEVSLTERLSQSLLLGRESVDELENMSGSETAFLRSQLFSPSVDQFLAACDEDTQKQIRITFENVATAARLHYYKVYFEGSDSPERAAQTVKAIEWLQRALMRDPRNPDLQIKLADLYGMQGNYDDAASILERLAKDDESPQYSLQWLGYFLLFAEGRELDAIKASLAYHERFPLDGSAIFNASCGYAQLYTEELTEGNVDHSCSINRKKALEFLKKAIKLDEDNRELALKYSASGDSFADLAEDPEFTALTSRRVAHP
jgi:tetratricopeptide (TPR) repeat protein